MATTERPSLTGLPAGTLIPGDADYETARLAWNLSARQNPAAIVQPETAAEVAAAVRAARAAGLRVSAQATGHNAVPLGDLSDTVLIRTGRMRRSAIDPVRRIARAEAGSQWQDVVDPASPMGLSMLHGSAPDIGIVGYSLGGGVGWQARLRGLAANSLTAVELVTADGEQVRVDRDNDPDLFWALRGGGGNFGVVTAVEFRLYPLSGAYAGWLIFPWERSRDVLARWAEWTLDAPEEVTSIGRILQLPPLEMIPEPLRGRNIVVVETAFLGDEESGRRLLAPLRELGPEMDTFAMVPPHALARLHMDPEDPMPGMGDQAMVDRFDRDAVEAFVEVAGPGSGSPLMSVEMRHLGGAVGRPAPDGGALSHIDAGYIGFGVSVVMTPEMGVAIDAQLRRFVAAMEPFGHGRQYLNFAESPTDAASFYDRTAYDRLRDIRRRVDPDGVLRANHELPRD